MKQESSKIKTRLTWLGKLFVGVSILLYVASLTSRSSLLLAPLGILFACLWINRIQARRALESVDIEPPVRILAEEHAPIAEPVFISNRSNQPVGFLTLEMQGKPWMDLAGLGPFERLAWKATKGFAERGRYFWKDGILASTYPFGLLEARRLLGLNGEILVHPKLFACEAPKAAGLDPMVGGKFRGRGGSVSGAHFSGVRPYQVGDSIQRIHWKSSAKGLGWMTKQFEEELSGKAAILLELPDTSEEPEILDCLRLAGSLAFAALDEGHQVEFIILGDSEPLKVAPFEDGTQILEALASASSRRILDADGLRLAREALSRKSALNVVTPEFRADWSEIIQSWRAMENRVCRMYLPETWRGPLEKQETEILDLIQFYSPSGPV
jgi:uncharacterized protein (DUF58 family)